MLTAAERAELKSIWNGIRYRCLRAKPGTRSYVDYRGRGILLCDEWAASFDAFAAYVGPRPSRVYSLDRIDNNRGYEPGNVRWATRTEQAQNTRPAAAAIVRRRHEMGPHAPLKRGRLTAGPMFWD